MTIIKDVVNLWKAEDLLSQAWNRSYEMMELSREIFNQAVIYLRNGENIETLIALKKRDREINAFQQEVRRKVLTHYSVEQKTSNMVNGLILINMVVDIERIGDYSKNILDLNGWTEIIIETKFGNMIVKQIAGLVARRILCYAKEGKKMLAGDRLGFIRFGSRTDIILPHKINLNVEFDQKVYGAETILGTYES